MLISRDVFGCTNKQRKSNEDENKNIFFSWVRLKNNLIPKNQRVHIFASLGAHFLQ